MARRGANLERAQRIDALLSAALKREEAERACFLADSCEGDEELRREVMVFATTGFALARALRDSGRDLKRARQLALLAREAYIIDGEGSKKELAEVDGWLHEKWPELARKP